MAEWPIAPVLKTGVPARVPRVRIPVSPLPIGVEKRSVYLRNPEFSRGFFAFMAPEFLQIGPRHVLHSAVQTHAEKCKSQRAVRHQYGHLGTTDGSSSLPFSMNISDRPVPETGAYHLLDDGRRRSPAAESISVFLIITPRLTEAIRPCQKRRSLANDTRCSSSFFDRHKSRQ